MSDIVEGIGTATEGGLFARVLDPGSGAKDRHEGDPEECLNCGTRLVGAYCHACGQSGHIHRTIGGFMHDLLHGALHFEGKMWRTLPMLVLRPGKLTRRYIEGARARFVSPMALFLFSVFLMFGVFQALGLSAPTDIGSDEEEPSEFVAGTEDGTADEANLPNDETFEGLQAEIARDLADPDLQEVLEPRVFNLEEDGNARMTVSPTGVGWLDEGLFKKWRDNPSLMLYKLQANAYKFSWLLIPISLPFLWLLFAWKRRFKVYDHAIFVTYSLSFMTLLFVTISVLDAAGMTETILIPAFFLIPPIHIYKQLRGAYELSRFSAFWRLLVLSLFIWVVALIFLQALLLLGAF